MKTDKWKDFCFNKPKDFNLFYKDFVEDVKNQLNGTGWEILIPNKGYFYLYIYLYHKRTDKYMYLSISDVRYFHNDWRLEVLIRTVKNMTDFIGGANQYTRLSQLGQFLFSMN